MRRILLSLASLIFVALGTVASAQTVPNVPDAARYVAYNVTSATTNFDVPFALYGDCTDLTVKIAGVVQTSGFTCISKSGTPFANVAQPVTDAQVQFTSAITNSQVEIAGNRHPRFSMGTAPGVTRQEFNRTLGTIISRQRESYDRLLPLGASMVAGFGLPSISVGTSGGFYQDLTTGDVYGPKTSTWPGVPAYTPVTASTLNPNLSFVAGSPGVVCDGVSDANAGGALQAVINNAATARHRLFWPPASDCHLKTAISVPSQADWEGFATTISFDPNMTLGNPIGGTPLGMSLINTSNFRFSGLVFNGPGSAAVNSGVRIVGQNITDGVIVNSVFQNFGMQTAFTGTLTSGSPTITGIVSGSMPGLKVGMNVNIGNTAIIGTITAVGTNSVTMNANATTNGATSLIANFYAQGFAAFTPTNIKVEHSTFQLNAGDGLAFSNNVRRVRIFDSQFLGNQDSAFVLCTIGGSDNEAAWNSVSAPLNLTNPAVASERCTGSKIAHNKIDASPGSQAIRVARYGDTAEINQDTSVIDNTVTGGANISIENAGVQQGSQTVAKGGLLTVMANKVISASGTGIHIVNSSNGTYIGNIVTGAGAEGILEEAASPGVSTGNNIVADNIVDGATYCFRQLSTGGTIIKSQYTGNDPRNCSVVATQFVNADVLDRGGISGSAPAANLTGAVLASGVTQSYLQTFGASPHLGTPILEGGFATLNGTTSGATFLAWPAVATGGTWTFQNGTDTIVGRASTDTLTNKTISGASNTISNIAATALTGTLQAGQFPALTGDATTSAGALATTLATVNSNVGSFGSSTGIPNFTVDGKGRITAAGTNAVIAPAGTLTGSALAAGITSSSLTSVGTLTGGATGAGFTVNLGTSTISGTLPTANTAALTGDVTKSAGSNTTAYGNVVPANKGGAGTVNGALKGDGAGNVAQAACANLSDGTTNCSAAVGQLPGTTTNDNAAAGKVGEYVAVAASNASASGVTVTIASPAVVTWPSALSGAFTVSGTLAGCVPVNFTTTGALPTGIVAGTTYYVVTSSISGNTFQIATSCDNAIAGTAINTSGTQSGTHTGISATANLTTASPINFAALRLTAGDWDVSCTINYRYPASTNVTEDSVYVSSSSAANDNVVGNFGKTFYGSSGIVPGAGADIAAVSPLVRKSLSGNTTVYCVEYSTFTVSTETAWGVMRARRAR